MKQRADGGTDQGSEHRGEKHVDHEGHCRCHQAGWLHPAGSRDLLRVEREQCSQICVIERMVFQNGQGDQREGRLDTEQRGKSLLVQGSASTGLWPSLACNLFFMNP